MRPRPCSPGGYERRSTPHLSVRQRSPLRNSFCPSRRHCLHCAPVSLAIASRSPWRPVRYTRRRLRGRQPLWAWGVRSGTPVTSSPAACSERIAVSRPDPGPLTYTSTFCSPCSRPLRAAASAVTCAAKGVDLREPLKPAPPADSHAITLPSVSVSDTIVLLKEVLMCACPTGMFFFGLRRPRARLGAAGPTFFPPPSSPPPATPAGPCPCVRLSSGSCPPLAIPRGGAGPGRRRA